jgi:hypothetical protein
MLPRSVLFDGRRVHYRVVILMTIAMRQQRPRGMTMGQLSEETGADFKTIRRWQAEYRREFEAGRYRLLRGRFGDGLRSGAEVAELVSYFFTQNESESGVVRLLQFVAENEHLSPGIRNPRKRRGAEKNRESGYDPPGP